ncbi:ABC transporter substrate-binding protein [Bradyrhizobium sp. AUGA SZCCT0182]|uniref:ABC transporter substrate-binding protein n=1 Tax=Bradyrhizobium sp. AUGA SZCCT0182 TaxID=2807667 RepID=UPI001BA6D51A|nr:ABC transporter substrate-binding protein [Bradyrhizobium sp. AUGA SZCCT0182]MBR1238301.1 ABC transporter substrate-binding protein [Bradyrhizobium sp. AUGA SZCCT0182]
MRRRDFIGHLGGAAVAWPLAAFAQQSTNKKRIVIFSPAEPSAHLHDHSESKSARALFVALRRLGWIEGQNLKVESYGREQNTSDPEALATEIVRSNPDVIFVVALYAVIFKKLTSRIPIVGITGDPVRQGLAESLAHPGGNFTGVTVDAGSSIYGKRIALLREMVPTMSKLGCLAVRLQWNQPNAGAFRAAAETAGLPLAVSLLEFGTSEADIRAAVESISRDGADAVMVLESPQVFQNSTLIAKLLGDATLPAIFPFTESVEAGGLMAYSFDLIELYKRVANNIDAILRGARPGDIPIYQVTKFELSINLKTAKQLGLSVPPALIAIADKVIE